MSDDIRNQLKNGVSSHVLNEEYEHSKKQIMEHTKFVSADSYEYFMIWAENVKWLGII